VKKRLTLIFLFGICLFLFSPLAKPQPNTSSSTELLSLDFRDVDIGDALRGLAKQYGLNIILSQEVKGPITIRFSNVTIDEAIDAIVTINGFAYTKRDNVIKVTAPRLAEPSTRLFHLSNVKVTPQLRDALRNANVLSSVGKLDIDERTNNIFITDLPGNLLSAEKLLKSLDNVKTQVRIEAKVIETVLDKTDRLGIDWTIKAGIRGAKRPTTAPFNALKDDRLSRVLPQGQPSNDTSNATFPVIGTDPINLIGYPYGFPYAQRSDFVYGTLDFSEFSAVLELLKQRANTTILSSPAITTLDSREAEVLIGTRVPIPIYELNEQTGTYVIIGYSEERVGVTLRVTPRVNAEGYISMDIHPEVSSIVGYTGPNNERPIVSTRQVDTQVQIKDGETVVIGGLIKEDVIDSIKRVPFLGYLPVIGSAFRKINYTKQKSELLIFITAHILSDEKKQDISYQAMNQSIYQQEFKEEIAEYKERTKRKLKLQKPQDTSEKELKLEKK